MQDKIINLDFKSILTIIITSLAVGILYAMVCIVPMYMEFVEGSYSYVPVRYYSHSSAGADDDYLYYSYVREIYDNKGLATSPDAYENKGEISQITTYSLSLFLGGLAGMIFNKMDYAYCFNMFIFPALNFSALLLILFLLTQFKIRLGFLILVSFLIMLFNFSPMKITSIISHLAANNPIDATISNDIYRMPNILITNLHLFVFAIVVFSSIYYSYPAWIKISLFSLVLGLSSFISIANNIICWIVYLLFFIAYIKKKDLNKIFLLSGLIGVLVSIPGWYVLLKILFSSISTLYAEWGYGMPLDQLKRFDSELFYYYLNVFIWTIPLLLCKYQFKKEILLFIFGILIAYILVSFTQGTEIGIRILKRGGALLLLSFMIVSYLNIILDIIHRIAKLNLLKKSSLQFIKIIIIGTLFTGNILFFMFVGYNQIRFSQTILTEHNDKSFKELYQWASKNTSSDDVVLSLDFDLITHLPIYTGLNNYIPMVIRATTHPKEIFLRFYETLNYYGVPPEKLKYLLSKLNNHYVRFVKDLETKQLKYMQLALFYGSNRRGLPQDLQKKFITEYVQKYYRKRKKLKFKANYLIISQFDKNLITDNSLASINRAEEPVFKNDSYAVYRLDTKGLK